MNLRRLAGAAGLLSAALFVLTIILTFVAGAPPALDDPVQDVASYYEDNQGLLQVNGIIGFITLFTIPLWFIPLYRWIRDRAWAAGGGGAGASAAATPAPAGTTAAAAGGGTADDDAGVWATVAFGGFIATGAIAATQTGVATALAQSIEDIRGSDEVVVALFDTYNGLGAAIGPVFALFAVGLAFASRGTGLLPNWTRPVLLVAAVLSLISILAPFTESDAIGLLGLLAFVLFIVALIGSSLSLLSAPRSKSAAAGGGTPRG